jgi:hypothetical protein
MVAEIPQEGGGAMPDMSGGMGGGMGGMGGMM